MKMLDNRKKKTLTKYKSLLLCLMTIIGMVVISATLARASMNSDVQIYQENKNVKHVTLSQSEKKEIEAVYTLDDTVESYQWQILADNKEDLWIDIYEENKNTLTLSYALLKDLLDDKNKGYVRCQVKTEEAVKTSNEIAVTITYDTPNDSSIVEVIESNDSQTLLPIGESEYVTITVNYLDEQTKLPIYSQYVAQIEKGTSYNKSLVSPTYLGYKPYYNSKNLNEDDPKNCNDSATSISIYVGESYQENQYIVNVYYKASEVSYAVKYLFQNVHDDFYTENTSLYRIGQAKTGSVISDAELDLSSDLTVGFTKLYHFPQAVAADGSTVFECYYERKYSLIRFDLDGGYGVEPVYARYETPFVVNEPERLGYIFKGWDRMDENGEYDGNADILPSTIPDQSQTYKAIWEHSNTKYTVVYWLQNADDDEYSYIGSKKMEAISGDIITMDEDKDDIMLTADTIICNNQMEGHVHDDNCIPQNFKHYLFDETKTNEVNKEAVVEGDGSTVFNVYYTRQYYTLRFVYAKEYKAACDNKAPGLYSDSISIVGGSTHGFGKKNGTLPQDYTLDNLIYKIESGYWGNVKKLPVVKTPSSTRSIQYETGVYPAEGEGYTAGYGNGNYNYNGDRFYYFDITARYDADLSAVWPIDSFEKIEVPVHSANGANNYRDEGQWGNYAYLAGWNGEYKVGYTLENSNPTIKGLYQKMDDSLLFGSNYSYTDDRKITTTVNGKTVNSYVNYYLAFFENGANVSWSIPKEWNYELLVPVLYLDEKLLDDEKEMTKQLSSEGKYYEKEIDGVKYSFFYYETNNEFYQLAAKYTTYDDNGYTTLEDLKHQTQTNLVGFEFAGTELKHRVQAVSNGKNAAGQDSYTARWFYARNGYDLKFYNYNTYSLEVNDVEFKSELDWYVYYKDSWYVPGYPEGLEPNAYSFKGWYTSPGCYEGSEYQKGTRMPDSDETLYAKWEANQYTVNFFLNRADMNAYEQDSSSLSPLYSFTIEHGDVVGSVHNPENDNYIFNGWFYIENGEKVAYTPLDIPIKKNLNVYAEWGSLTAQSYKIYFALEKVEKDENWLNELNKQIPVSNGSYQVSFNGETRNYVYLDDGYHLEIANQSSGFAYQGSTKTFYPKTGYPMNELYEAYNSNYYPTLASHSITISENENVYTFLYTEVEEIEYTVEYRYKDTNELISSEVKTTNMSVVTERFKEIEGYLPDSFYKRLILAHGSDGTSDATRNVITFYYTENQEKAYYAVHYMLQNLNATSDALDVDESGNYVNYTESSQHTELIGKVGDNISISAPSFTGFSVKENGKVQQGSVLNDISSNDSIFTITIDASGSELYVFYTRNIVDYSIYYLLDGTDISNLSQLLQDSILSETVTLQGYYGATITSNAKVITGMTCVSNPIQSIVLSQNISQNNIIFFYTPLSYNVQYKVWSQGGGVLDNTIEVIQGNATTLKGSTPSAQTGYEFAGWYLDALCTDPVVKDSNEYDKGIVDEQGKVIPNLNQLHAEPKTNVFYAKFVPIYGELTISRENCLDEGNGEQNFVYKITSISNPDFVMVVSIQENQSLTIKNLQVGKYQIEQQNGWSWRYEDGFQIIDITKNAQTLVTFNDNVSQEYWLNGNSNPLYNQAKE